MRLHGNASARLGRLVLGMTMTAALAVTLAACSSSGTAKQAVTKQPVSAASGAAAPAASAPAPAAAPAANALSDKWSGQYSGAYQGTFILRWHQSGSKLNGTIQLSNPGTSLPIHGHVAGGSIRFGTVGSYAITYSGAVSGNSMSGTYQVHAGNVSGGPWNASKTS